MKDGCYRVPFIVNYYGKEKKETKISRSRS